MPHARKSIRDAVASLLIAGSTSAGSNVFTNRPNRAWQSELPAIFIQSGSESANPRALNVTNYRRTLDLKIELKIEENDTTDDDLDALALQVETIMNANQLLGLSGTVTSVVYQGSDPTITSEGEQTIGVLVMNYQVQYIQ
jgi:hypothetical protein